MSWGDEVDEELKQDTDIKVGFILSFKSMINTINAIIETQRTWDDRHPRDSFRRIWLCTMPILLLCFCMTHSVLCIATLPFIGFYSFVLIKLASAYKNFGYKRAGYWWTTIGAILILIVLAFVIQKYVIGW